MGFASVAMALNMVRLSSVCCIMLKLSVDLLKWPQGLDEIPPPTLEVLTDACCLEAASARRLDGPDRRRVARFHSTVLYSNF